MILSYSAGLHGHKFSDPPVRLNQSFTPRRNPLTGPSSSRDSILRRNSINESVRRDVPRPISSLLEQTYGVAEHRVRFQESKFNFDLGLMSLKEDDSLEIADDSSTIANKGATMQKRDSRTSSVFHIAHPAPTLTQTQKLLLIRPKLLLQLQLVSSQTRPKPSVDVLPSTVIAPRLANKLPRLFRGNRELGINDVIVVRSEDYNTGNNSGLSSSDTDEDGLMNRELMAVICQMPRDRGASLGVAEIVLSDGSVCTATPLLGGTYEILTTDERGYKLTAHWWIKKCSQRESVESPDYSHRKEDPKFAFSIIDPDFRKHPIMATITQKNLEVMDSYSKLSKSSSKHPPLSNMPNGLKGSRKTDEPFTLERKIHMVDKRLQTLIQVTGIWVSLRQGWSPYFKYNDAIAVACSTTGSQNFGRVRSLSLTSNIGSSYTGYGQSKTHDSSQPSKGLPLGNNIRRPSVIGRPSVSRNVSFSEIQAKTDRAVSAGAAYVQRAAAHKSSHLQTTMTSDFYEKNLSIQRRRTVTERSSTSNSYPASTSPRLSLPNYYMATSETAKNVPRRAQSVYYPLPSYKCDLTNMPDERKSTEVVAEVNPRNRNSRRKAVTNFTNFFRRINSISSRSKYT